MLALALDFVVCFGTAEGCDEEQRPSLVRFQVFRRYFVVEIMRIMSLAQQLGGFMAAAGPDTMAITTPVDELAGILRSEAVSLQNMHQKCVWKKYTILVAGQMGR